MKWATKKRQPETIHISMDHVLLPPISPTHDVVNHARACAARFINPRYNTSMLRFDLSSWSKPNGTNTPEEGVSRQCGQGPHSILFGCYAVRFVPLPDIRAARRNYIE